MLDYLPETIMTEDLFNHERTEIIVDQEPLQFLKQNQDELEGTLKSANKLDDFLFQN